MTKGHHTSLNSLRERQTNESHRRVSGTPTLMAPRVADDPADAAGVSVSGVVSHPFRDLPEDHAPASAAGDGGAGIVSVKQNLLPPPGLSWTQICPP